MNVVIDTNIWISFLIGKKLTPLKDLVLDKKIVVLTSEEQIKEIIRVVERPKFYKYFSEDDINELIILLEYYCININIENIIIDCRDSKDNFLLEIGLNGEADYLITGDNDLLEMNPYKGLKIINLREFENIIKNC